VKSFRFCGLYLYFLGVTSVSGYLYSFVIDLAGDFVCCYLFGCFDMRVNMDNDIINFSDKSLS
jgi:hypothetical protein